MLDKIKQEFPELYEQLMEHIKLKKQLSYAFCRDLLNEYNLNLDEEKKLLMMEHANKFRNDTSFLNDSNDISGIDLNQTNLSDMLSAGQRDSALKPAKLTSR